MAAASYIGTVMDGNSQERIGGTITFTALAQPAGLDASGVFANVTKPTVGAASSAAIIAALVTLGLVIDGT